jgi:exosortase/archaeosortase
LWASIGWGLFSIIIGLILDQVSKGQTTTNYKPAFYMMMVLLILDFLITSRIKVSKLLS